MLEITTQKKVLLQAWLLMKLGKLKETISTNTDKNLARRL